MMNIERTVVRWQSLQVTSPLMLEPVRVVAARGVPYTVQGNRLQCFNCYLPATPENLALVDSRSSSLPKGALTREDPLYQVHVHGGAWRDPYLSAASIEAEVALAIRDVNELPQLLAISLDYTLANFPTHPDNSYDSKIRTHIDIAREGKHPQQVSDVIQGLLFLRSLGIAEQSFILTGHSCGACIRLPAILQDSSFYGLVGVPSPRVQLPL